MNLLFYLISMTLNLKSHTWLLVAVVASTLLYSDVSYTVISGLGVPLPLYTGHLPLIHHVILVPSEKKRNTSGLNPQPLAKHRHKTPLHVLLRGQFPLIQANVEIIIIIFPD